MPPTYPQLLKEAILNANRERDEQQASGNRVMASNSHLYGAIQSDSDWILPRRLEIMWTPHRARRRHLSWCRRLEVMCPTISRRPIPPFWIDVRAAGPQSSLPGSHTIVSARLCLYDVVGLRLCDCSSHLTPPRRQSSLANILNHAYCRHTRSADAAAGGHILLTVSSSSSSRAPEASHCPVV